MQLVENVKRSHEYLLFRSVANAVGGKRKTNGMNTYYSVQLRTKLVENASRKA